MAKALEQTIKPDYVAMKYVPTATHVMSKLAEWFEDCNERAPHKGLGMKSPREYISSMTAGSTVRFDAGYHKTLQKL